MASARCPECGYRYVEEAGHLREGFPAGTPWSAVPQDWNCPDCAICDKADFIYEGHTVAESMKFG